MTNEVELKYAGVTSTFAGRLPAPSGAGPIELEVLAMEAAAANFGMVRQTIRTNR